MTFAEVVIDTMFTYYGWTMVKISDDICDNARVVATGEVITIGHMEIVNV